MGAEESKDLTRVEGKKIHMATYKVKVSPSSIQDVDPKQKQVGVSAVVVQSVVFDVDFASE